MTENATEKLAAFEQGLSALKDNTVRVAGKEYYKDEISAFLAFSNGSNLRMDYWRLLRNGLAVVSSFDHRQLYGLPQPIDAIEDLRATIEGQHVIEARLDRQTGDLLFAFSGRAHVQAFNLSGYEKWEMAFPQGSGGDYSNFIISYLHAVGR